MRLKKKVRLFTTTLFMSLLLMSCLYIFQKSPANSNNLSTIGRNHNNYKLYQHIGAEDSWTLFDQTSEADISQWHPESGKVIFLYEEPLKKTLVLVGVKKTNKKSKNELFEFPGGRIDVNETPTESVMRELREEDPSLVLESVFKQNLTSDLNKVRYKNIQLKNHEHHTLYLVQLKPDDWLRLQSSWKKNNFVAHEVYDFLLVPIKKLNTRKIKYRTLWTKKSHKMLKTLRHTTPF